MVVKSYLIWKLLLGDDNRIVEVTDAEAEEFMKTKAESAAKENSVKTEEDKKDGEEEDEEDKG